MNNVSKFINVKTHFPIFSREINGFPLNYLDSAATSQKPREVIDSLVDFYSFRCAPVHRGVYELSREATLLYGEARKKVKNLINAQSDKEIIFVKGATEALNLIGNTLVGSLIPGNATILISSTEHHANSVSWTLLSQRTDITIKLISVDDEGCIVLESLEDLLKEKAHFVCIAHVSNVFGRAQPLKEIIRLSHAYGAYVCIDGAQSAPHFPIDVQDLDTDFFVFSGHKIYGPTGVGVLYGKQSILHKLSPIQGGGDMVATYSEKILTFEELPLKFEAGTPSIASIIGLGAAIDYVNKFSITSIHYYERLLVEHALIRLQEIPNIFILGGLDAMQKGSLISFFIKGVHHLDIVTMLDTRGIAIRSGNLCSFPAMQRLNLDGVLRISFGIYNDLNDIDAFIYHLKDILNFFR